MAQTPQRCVLLISDRSDGLWTQLELMCCCRGTAAPASSGTPVFSSPAKPDAAGDGKRGAFILFEGLDRSGERPPIKPCPRRWRPVLSAPS
eukprot:COSAG04_NODE_713_length_10870_cov_3.260050_9_plen_91_part_00